MLSDSVPIGRIRHVSARANTVAVIGGPDLAIR